MNVKGAAGLGDDLKSDLNQTSMILEVYRDIICCAATCKSKWFIIVYAKISSSTNMVDFIIVIAVGRINIRPTAITSWEWTVL